MIATPNRRAVLLGLGLATLGACAPARQQSGGSLRDSQGAERPSEGGVGGTGIVGTLTSEALLSVNGLGIAPEPGLVARGAFGPRRVQELSVGETVTIEAAPESDGRLVARSLAVNHPLVGPVEEVRPGKLRVLGVEVALEDGIPLVGPEGPVSQLRGGERVAISGLWRGKEVVASRIDLMPPLDTAVSVGGVVEPGRSAARPRLGALELSLPPGQTVPQIGSYVTAVGRQAGGLLVAESIEEGRFFGAAGPIARLSIEGYLDPADEAPGYTLAGLGHSFDAAAKLADLAGTRALYVGPYDGTFKVRYGVPLPEEPTARDALLNAIEDGLEPEPAVSTR